MDNIAHRKIAYNNITHFDTFDDYQKYANQTREEFQEQLDNGFIQSITQGTYNATTNIFTPKDLTVVNQLNAINQAIKDDSDFLSDYNECFSDDLSFYHRVRNYTEIFNVFTIENYIYVDMD